MMTTSIEEELTQKAIANGYDPKQLIYSVTINDIIKVLADCMKEDDSYKVDEPTMGKILAKVTTSIETAVPAGDVVKKAYLNEADDMFL